MGGAIPAIDFAGGTVVHISSGVSALVCALVLGRRRGYRTHPMPPHSVVLSVIGAAMLWVGWFGFNAGSALHANALASAALINTHFAAAAGALGWTFIEWIKGGKPTVLGAISGAVAGLVVITPASGFTLPIWAMVMGFTGGVICFFAATTLKHAAGYDDSLDAFGVHGVGGTLGAILTGVFAVAAVNLPVGFGNTTRLGLIEGNTTTVLHQLIATGAAWAMAAVGSVVILMIVKPIFGLRVDEEDEYAGLDLSQHGESGYNIEDAFSATYAGGGATLLSGNERDSAALVGSTHG
jgi:Amt family ammonium transporter